MIISFHPPPHPRGQLLARTVRGMMCYDKALRILARMEHPPIGGGGQGLESPLTHEPQFCEMKVRSLERKFSLLVSAQVIVIVRALMKCYG